MSLHGFLYMMDTEEKTFLEFEEDLRSNRIQTLTDLRTAIIEGKTHTQLNIPNWAYEDMKDKLLSLAIESGTKCNNPYIVYV